MSLSQVRATLLQPEIKQKLLDAGIVHLWVFGSIARGTSTEESDVDLLYEFDEKKVKEGSWGVRGLYSHLEECLGKKVDLVSKDFVHPLIKESVFSSRTYIY